MKTPIPFVLAGGLLLVATAISPAQSTFTRIITGPIVTNLAGGAGVTWVDYDNDGDLDLHSINRDGPSRLYRNDGDGTFTQIKAGPLVNTPLDAHSLSWADSDNDGYIGLFIGNTSQSCLLFRQRPDGAFVQSALGSDALGAAWVDYDNDGWLDAFVSEVLGGKNRLYCNKGDGTFSRVLTGPIADDVGNGCCSSWGEMDPEIRTSS
jgi:hypothetical protein